MTAAAILALIQAGELAVPAIIAAWEKFRDAGGTTIGSGITKGNF